MFHLRLHLRVRRRRRDDVAAGATFTSADLAVAAGSRRRERGQNSFDPRVNGRCLPPFWLMLFALRSLERLWAKAGGDEAR